MDWIEIIVRTTSQGADIVAAVLYEAGANGAVIEDPADIQLYQRPEGQWDYIDESLLDRMDSEVLVKGYLADDEKLHDRLQYIRNRIQYLLTADLGGIDLGSGSLEFHTVKEDDWANNWKKYYKPVHVTDHIVIKPSWENYQPKEGEKLIELDPGMAFGTGTHETTVMCIQMLEKYVKTGMKVFDVGCGTGILSIVTGKQGAKSVMAIDIDPTSVKIARENARLNDLEHVIIPIEGNLLDRISDKAHVIVANIIADVILALTPDIGRFLYDDGIFISSGIIQDRSGEVEEALKRYGFNILERQQIGEWVAFACKR
ncbi:MAG: 50S ribosomal protein L11 methyltransferase [Clostridia bacterium]|jgi:ribosomal protein L11 methyltransferase